MRTLFRLTVFVAMFLLLTFVASVWPFDKEPGRFPEWFPPDQEYVDLSNTIVYVRAFGTAIGVYMNFEKEKLERAPGQFRILGVGTVVGNYVITAAHVVVPRRVTMWVDKHLFYISHAVEEVSKVITVGDLDAGIQAFPVFVDDRHDLAVLRIWDNPVLKSLPYQIGWTYQPDPMGRPWNIIAEGDAVAVVVRKRGEGGEILPWFEVRYGKVRKPAPAVPDGLEWILPWFNLEDVTIDVEIFPGDSGSPVFMFEDGKPVLVGVARARAYTRETYSYFVRIDLARRIVEAG